MARAREVCAGRGGRSRVSSPMLSALLTLSLLAAPKVGDVAPDFTVTDVDGAELTLSSLVERGPVVLAFFPKAFTPG